ncbi:MAG: hypothetical protein V4610_11915 [Pseudomonadota bacterium]
MAHTPEECARRILVVYRAHKAKPGTVLKRSAFAMYFTVRPWTLDDLEVGMFEAINREWISALDHGELRLLRAGEKEFASRT